MVSLQSPNDHRGAAICEAENSATPQKRKYLEVQVLPNNHDSSEKRPKPQIKNFMSADIELQLETPLPSEWQRCLDIQSGKIHFYNTKTHARTSTDPRTTPAETPEPERPMSQDQHMSLDLDLNLTTSESVTSAQRHVSSGNVKSSMESAERGKGRKPEWMALAEAERQEMVATVCVKCHMLVMLCRSSPACPNCKFVHSATSEKTLSTTSFVQVKL